MGTVHPEQDSKWMDFSKSVKQKWNFWEEFNLRERYVNNLISRYSTEASPLLRLKLGFRILANTQLVLKEAYAKIFKDIPFESFLHYVDSFEYKNCKVWDNLAEIVMRYTQSSE